VLALTLDNAETIALVAATALAIGAVVAFFVMKSIAQKLAAAVLLGLLAYAVWTQRVSLQDCADKVKDNVELAASDVAITDTECSFFGFTVTIADPVSDVSPDGD
jgi:hypothetical protein